MLHLQIITPADLTEQTVTLLRDNPATTHIVVLLGAAREPQGDLIQCDVAREGANGVLDALRASGIESRGAITAQDVDLVLSVSARRAARAAPGLGADAVVWEEIAQKTGEETRLSATYLIFLCVATIIAGIGVLLDQPILIVGAMVVGPEFGPLAALCLGLLQRHRVVVLRSVMTLIVGFAAAMAVTVLTTWALTAIGLINETMLTSPRPMTDFIWRPDALSWIIAFLAGVAGMLSLTSAKSGALIGVLISVTTVPAAANAAVALAYGVWHEAWGSAVQLLVNVTAIVVAGVLTLAAQQLWWKRSAAAEPPKPSVGVKS